MTFSFFSLAFFLVFSTANGRSLPPHDSQTATATATAISRHPHHHRTTSNHHHFKNSNIRPPPPHRAAAVHPPEIRRLQAFNIIDAILGTEDFGIWKNILSGDELGVPISATLFLPTADPRQPLPADPLLAPYHTVPERLVFADLRRLSLRSRLPTLLLSKTILVTNNSAGNFTVDGSFISRADLFTSETIAVHGVTGFLDYTIYGDSSSMPPPPPSGVLTPPPPPAAVQPPPTFPAADLAHTHQSCACQLSGLFSILFALISYLV